MIRGVGPQVGGEAKTGRLVLAATPIGDVADASPKLLELLSRADVVAAEDTRRLRRLTAATGTTIAGRVTTFHEHNESTRAGELVAAAAEGALVVVVTDAGMPSVSDPGLRAVRAAIEAGVAVQVVPGPSAVLTALAVSGLATDRFCFEGFLPRKAGERSRSLAALTDESRTMVFFEAPHRLAVCLAAMVEAFGGDRPAAVCRELTKTYEQVLRGGLAELSAWAGGAEVLGEITVVVAGRPAPDPNDLDAAGIEALVSQVRARTAAGERLKDAVAAVAAPAALPKRTLYDAVTHHPQNPS
jgi:16S rRNA (cytidine1402-2'-O)-methyltransferase